ncbi:hypothetical protein CLIB1444_05S08526 [[Candida] jaroonii]|uniref:Uncharacterized protein n=1 Tax=[Candida] jaroonii TaxID=467808 RepID=A0ACA9Y8H6_9ASCO|nr:hypothetical protein CLIB1444_05S08526 [[Candida] jaroonii]
MEPDTKKKKPNSNRKNAQATRTLRACELCRKQKTRCFKVNDDSPSCLRCTFLNKPCSFGTGNSAGSSSLNLNSNEKLDMIYKGVNDILTLLKADPSILASIERGSDVGNNPPLSTVGLGANNPMLGLNTFNGVNKITNNDARLLLEAANSMKNSPINEDKLLNPVDIENQTNFKSPNNSLSVAPFQIIHNKIPGNFLPKSIENLLQLSSVDNEQQSPVSPNIISLNILNINDAINFMNDFRRNYGRWVSFPSNLPTEILVERLLKKSPLLLTTCCTMSLRYSFNNLNPGDINNITRKRTTFNLLCKQLINELNFNLIKINSFKNISGNIEFLQSMVILSIYSLSLTSIIFSNDNELKLSSNNLKDLNINLNQINFDPWYLSGTALTIFISKISLGNLLPKNNTLTSPTNFNNSPFTILYDEELDSNEYQTLTIMRIYNHLILVHLMSCIFSGRMCLVDEIRLNYCNITLGLPSSTNFDGRMVSEISILLVTYNYIQTNLNFKNNLKGLNDNFNNTLQEIKSWYEQWEYLFQQPALQFVELCYNFCYLIIYYSYNFQKYLVMNNFEDLHDHNLFNKDNIKFILSQCDEVSLKKLFEFSNILINFITLINNDSYFAYLSDQLLFCFYFGGIFLLNYLKFIDESDNFQLLGLTNANDLNSLNNIKLLIDKFDRISGDSNDDILVKYKLGLKHELLNTFPSFA